MTLQQFLADNLTLASAFRSFWDFVGMLFVGLTVVKLYQWYRTGSKENRTTIE